MILSNHCVLGMSKSLFQRLLSTSPRSKIPTASGNQSVISTEHRDKTELLRIPLTQAPSSAHNVGKRATLPEESNVQLTTLSNGLRVASLYKCGAGCTVGVVVSAGPRFQAGHTKGISHLVEKLSFSSTKRFSSHELLREMEECQSIFDTQSTKDCTIYAVSGNPISLDKIVNALSEVTTASLFNDEDIIGAKDKIRFEWESLHMNPSPEPIVTDLLHSAAFSSNTLGFPKLCPLENIDKFAREEVIQYFNTYYRPERMIICGVGVQHDELVKVAEQSFVKSDWPLKLQFEPDNSVSQYTGGFLSNQQPLSDMHSALGLPELVHVSIGLESCSTSDKDFVPSCVLHMLMGGGGSFSAGGPGKGMYTRLYTRVLNQYYWANHAQASNQAYADTGLFSILSSSPPNQAKEMCQVICREIRAMAGKLPHDEVLRAKRQLQSMLMMNLEMRPIVFEDIGRQLLSSGLRRPPEYWFDQIEKIEAKDLSEFAERMLLSKPSFVAYGPNLSSVPPLESIQEWLSSSKKDSSRFFSLHL